VLVPTPSAPLTTPRLVLRPRRIDEAPLYRQLWTERDSRVPPHRRIDAEGRPTVDDVAAQIASPEEQGLLAVVRQVDDHVIGYCGLYWGADVPPGDASIAFELLRQAQGHGYATEAGHAIVTWATQAGYLRLWAQVWDWNAASRRVLQKLGFEESGDAAERTAYGVSLLTTRNLVPPRAQS
jgi:ribosomal-protein-alanine N-acetyltransferase